jgi:hypothetical protein
MAFRNCRTTTTVDFRVFTRVHAGRPRAPRAPFVPRRLPSSHALLGCRGYSHRNADDVVSAPACRRLRRAVVRARVARAAARSTFWSRKAAAAAACEVSPRAATRLTPAWPRCRFMNASRASKSLPILGPRTATKQRNGARPGCCGYASKTISTFQFGASGMKPRRGASMAGPRDPHRAVLRHRSRTAKKRPLSPRSGAPCRRGVAPLGTRGARASRARGGSGAARRGSGLGICTSDSRLRQSGEGSRRQRTRLADWALGVADRLDPAKHKA